MAAVIILVAWMLGVVEVPPQSGSLEVAVVWSGEELERFETVIDAYERSDNGRPVTVISTGDDIDGFLRSRAVAGNLPDVAIFPEAGLLEDYVSEGWLEPLSADLEPRYAPFWKELGTVCTASGNETLFGAWVKGTFKSGLWYQEQHIDDGEIPTTWDNFLDLVGGLVEEEQSPPPLAIGAADTWVLTDWFENMLLVRAADELELYDELSAGEARWNSVPVRATLTRLARLLATERLTPGGADRALVTPFDESMVQVASDDAVIVHGSEFARIVSAGLLAETGVKDDLGFMRFPSDDAPAPVLLGGDVAVVMQGSDGGHGLVEWLTEPDSFSTWAESGGYFSPLRDGQAPERSGPNDDPDGVQARLDEIAEEVAVPPPHARFDLSNRGTTASLALGWVLRDLFEQVASDRRDLRGEDLDAAVTDAVDDVVVALDAAARQEPDHQEPCA